MLGWIKEWVHWGIICRQSENGNDKWQEVSQKINRKCKDNKEVIEVKGWVMEIGMVVV